MSIAMPSELCPISDNASHASVAVSVVVPVFNEAGNIEQLYAALTETLQATVPDYEIVVVDDGSSDATPLLLNHLAQDDLHLRVITLRRNSGQTAAMRTGLDSARGRIIVTMDGDLQNDARDIPLLLAELERGYDLVVGWRRDRKDPFLSRKLPSKMANLLIAWLTRVPIHDTGCSLKAYRAELVDRLPLYSELHRFIPAISLMLGARISEVVTRHHPRRSGVSKYGLSRIGKVLLDAVTVRMLMSFSQRPLHWFGLWSVPCLLLGLAAELSYFWQLAFAPEEGLGTVLATVGVLFFFLAVHLWSVGLLGELTIGIKCRSDLEPLQHTIRIK